MNNNHSAATYEWLRKRISIDRSRELAERALDLRVMRALKAMFECRQPLPRPLTRQ